MKKIAENFHGKLLGMQRGLLYGWVYDSTQYDERAIVEIYADDYPIRVVRAETWLPELSDQSIGDGCYGFFIQLPLEKLGYIQRIRARVANTDYWLASTVYPSVDSADNSRPVLGHVTNHSGLRVHGWAWDPDLPKHTVSLRFYEANQLLGVVLADQLRGDLLEQGIGNGQHGFSFSLPFALADGQPHEIRVFDEKSRAIPGSPLRVISFPAGFDNELNRQDFSASEHVFLSSLSQHYQHYVPASLDLAMYPSWFERFGKADVVPSTAYSFLLVIFGTVNIAHTVSSVLAQTHTDFRMLICGSFTHDDPRIESIAIEQWSATLAQQVKQHSGLLSFVEAGDHLEPDALTAISAAFTDPAVLLAYSDCDYQDDGVIKPWFKPDWDLDLFLAGNPLQYLCAIRAAVMPSKSPWLSSPDAWPWLAITAIGDKASSIRHIASVLYHRCAPYDLRATAAIASVFLPHIAPGATVLSTNPAAQCRLIQWSPPKVWPKVSVIIPTRDQKLLLERCIESLQKTDYPDVEIIVVDNDSQEAVTQRYLKKLTRQGCRILSYPQRFNYAAINNMAVLQASGDIVALLNNDVEAMESQWLKNLVTQLLRPGVGAVGAKLLWPNGMVQHAGVLLGLHGLAGHIGNNWEDNDAGYFGYNQMTRRVSAVTAACLLCYKADYLLMGGMDAQAFPVAFNDVDFCLRLAALGNYIVWTPAAKLWHAESASRGQDDLPAKQARLEKEKNELKQRWGGVLFADPFYNPNLNLDHYSHNGLSFPPRKIASLIKPNSQPYSSLIA